MSSTSAPLLTNRSGGSSTRNQEATIYIGNLDEKVTESLIWELMVQVGPVVHVHIPRDRISQQHQGYGFCEFQSEEDAEYAGKVMGGVKLFGKPMKINRSSQDKRNQDVGANLFVGNLAPEVDERILQETFSMFGTLIAPAKIARDPDAGESKGFGFVSFDSFENSDAAIESLNGQYLCNRPITVTYAYKKDGKGERHGTPAERLLAAQAKKNIPAAATTAPVQATTASMATFNAAAAPPGVYPGAMAVTGYPQMLPPSTIYYAPSAAAYPAMSAYPPPSGMAPQYYHMQQPIPSAIQNFYPGASAQYPLPTPPAYPPHPSYPPASAQYQQQ